MIFLFSLCIDNPLSGYSSQPTLKCKVFQAEKPNEFYKSKINIGNRSNHIFSAIGYNSSTMTVRSNTELLFLVNDEFFYAFIVSYTLLT